MNTYKKETIYKNKRINLGVEIGIFPLDSWNDDLKKAKLEAKRNQGNMIGLLLTKFDRPIINN